MNECWSAHFMSDALWCGRRFRTFKVVDDSNREVLAIAKLSKVRFFGGNLKATYDFAKKAANVAVENFSPTAGGA